METSWRRRWNELRRSASTRSWFPPLFQPGVEGDLSLAADPEQTHPTQAAGARRPPSRGSATLRGCEGSPCSWTSRYNCFAAEHPLVARHPEAFVLRRSAWTRRPWTHVAPAPLASEARARLEQTDYVELFTAFATAVLRRLGSLGSTGRARASAAGCDARLWSRVIAQTRAVAPDFAFIAETEGAPRGAGLALIDCGFDALTSSLPFWDGRARWLVRSTRRCESSPR